MTDLSELFARDPLQYSSADITAIIAAHRAARQRYAEGVKSAGKPAKKAISDPAPKASTASLEDLLNT